MRLLGKNKENSIENLSNGPGTEVGTRMFTNKYLIRLLWPLFVEQLLVFAIGIADSFMVASVGEEAVSAVSLVVFPILSRTLEASLHMLHAV